MIINRILHRDKVVNHDKETPAALTFPYISVRNIKYIFSPSLVLEDGISSEPYMLDFDGCPLISIPVVKSHHCR